MKIVVSSRYDAVYNLALEEYLTRKASQEGVILYLWQNNKAIIIGRNQNPYLECDIAYAKRNSIPIIRRMSGGGAVYHDIGNLNYTVIYESGLFTKGSVTDYLLLSLADVGIIAKKTGRNDIEIDGKKVSGTAYYHGCGFVCQHGCILVNTDLDKIGMALSPDTDKITSKGIKSVRARVANVSEFNAGVDINILQTSLIRNLKMLLINTHFYSESLEIDKQEIDPLSITDDAYRAILEKYSSDNWNLRKKIDMTYSLHSRFEWGDCTVYILSDCDVIEDIYFFSDALDGSIFQIISLALRGIPFERKMMIEKLERVMDETISKMDKTIISDIISLITEEFTIHE